MGMKESFAEFPEDDRNSHVPKEFRLRRYTPNIWNLLPAQSVRRNPQIDFNRGLADRVMQTLNDLQT